MHRGYMLLYRKLLDAPYFDDSAYVHVWIYLLLSANHAETKIKVRGSHTIINLKPGELITSRDAISARTKIHRSKIERILDVFEREQQIEQQKNSKFRIISITNWGEFQNLSNKRATSEQQVEKQVEQQKNAKSVTISATTSDEFQNLSNNQKKVCHKIEQQKNAESVIISTTTSDEFQNLSNKRATSEQQVSTNNTLYNNKIRGEKFTPPCVEDVAQYCRERNNGVDAERWINFYQAKDWMIGKNKMKDWKAAVRTWEKSTVQPQTEKGLF